MRLAAQLLREPRLAARSSFSRASSGAACATLASTRASNRDHGIRPSADSATAASTYAACSGSGRGSGGHVAGVGRAHLAGLDPRPQLRMPVVQVLGVGDQPGGGVRRAADPGAELRGRELATPPGRRHRRAGGPARGPAPGLIGSSRSAEWITDQW